MRRAFEGKAVLLGNQRKDPDQERHLVVIDISGGSLFR